MKKIMVHSGFSIIEMMVAMTIMSIAGAAVTLGMRAVQKSALNSENAMNVQVFAAAALDKIRKRHEIVGGIPSITDRTCPAAPPPSFPPKPVGDIKAMVIGFSGSNVECDFQPNNLNTLVITSTCEASPAFSAGSEPVNLYPDLTEISGCRLFSDPCKLTPDGSSAGRPVVTMSSTLMVPNPAIPGAFIKQIQPPTTWPQAADKSIWGAYACAENVMNTFSDTLVKAEYLGTNFVLLVGYRHYQGGKLRIIWQAHPTFLPGGDANAKAGNAVKP